LSTVPVSIQFLRGEEAMKLIQTMKQINDIKKDHTAISFFSGCGGSSTGHKYAGFNMLYSNEFVPEAVTTYKANHPGTFVDSCDIRKINPQEILDIIDMKVGELDLLDGSPPCCSFSVAGKREEGWGKERDYSEGIRQRTDDLFREYARMVKVIQPKVFIAENVPGLAQGNARGYLVKIFKELSSCGYSVLAKIVDSSWFDVPQTRKRLIIVGVRNDIVSLGFKPVFPEPNNYFIKVSDIFPYITGIRNPKKAEYTSSQRLFPTITASCATSTETAKFSCGAFVELKSGERRKLKIPELLRISSFPSDFVLTGTFEQQFERVGRAVPPMMMYHISKAIRNNILKKL
jgi:DNA (cytosine-5)-methyltransferase 1